MNTRWLAEHGLAAGCSAPPPPRYPLLVVGIPLRGVVRRSKITKLQQKGAFCPDPVKPMSSRKKADLARKSSETMSTDASKLAMLEIAQLYEHLAERTRQLEQLGVTAKK